MPSTKDIRNKIGAVKNTQKITRAMEMVAASKMRKAQDRMQKSRDYAREIRRVIANVFESSTEYRHPLLATREEKQCVLLIISSDRGLCGGLNTLLFKKAIDFMRDKKAAGVTVSLIIIGSKAQQFFKRIGAHVIDELTHLGQTPSVSQLVSTVKTTIDLFTAGKIDSLHIAFNEFKNRMTQIPTILPTLPMTIESNAAVSWDYIYEPDNAKQILDMLLARYIESQLYQSVVENMASEEASRMVAMKNATDNAGKVINELKQMYNKARQAAITRELAEIVAGAAAVE
jgi:F-type H+-transporting ATPase subunit gamma